MQRRHSPALLAFAVLLFALSAQGQRFGGSRLGRPAASGRVGAAAPRVGVLARARAVVRARVRGAPARSAHPAPARSPTVRVATLRGHEPLEPMAHAFGREAQHTLAAGMAVGMPSGAELRYVDDLSDSGSRFASGGELQDIAREHAGNPELPWRYIRDGCYARAHFVTHDLRSRGVVHGKIFATIRPGATKYLSASNRLMHASWRYHVAALAYERNPTTGQVEPWVIDPAVDVMPLAPHDWLSRIGGEDTDVDVTSDQQIVARDEPLQAPLHASYDEANTAWSKGALQERWAEFMDVAQWRDERQVRARGVTAAGEPQLRERSSRVRVTVKVARGAQHAERKRPPRTRRFWVDRADESLVAQLKATVTQQRPLALVVNPITREILSAGTPPRIGSE